MYVLTRSKHAKTSKQSLIQTVHLQYILKVCHHVPFIFISVFNAHQRIWITRGTFHLVTVTKYHCFIWSSLFIILLKLKLAFDSTNRWQTIPDRNQDEETAKFTKYTAVHWIVENNLKRLSNQACCLLSTQTSISHFDIRLWFYKC